MVTLNSAALDLVLHQLYVHFPVPGGLAVSYTHLTLPTKLEV